MAPGAIVLLSDGTNTTGRAPRRRRPRRQGAKVPVYTIAYGTENGSSIWTASGNPYRSTMRRCARSPRTSGDYFAAATASS